MKLSFFNQNWLSTLIGIFLGIFLLNYFFSDNKKQIRLDELALGKDNKAVLANFEGKRIHCGDTSDLHLCLKGYKSSNVELPVTLWLGNSQLHAINQYHAGDETAALQIHKELKKHNFYTLTFSQANANLQEHYLLLAYLLDQFQIKTLILPIVFDDLREDEVRPDLQTILNDQAYKDKINKTLTGKNLISKFNNQDLAGNDSIVSEDILNNSFENQLNEKLSKSWPLWREREILRGTLFAKLYNLRNSILGITASTTRRMIKGFYVKNINAYKDILNLALDNKVEVLVYIPPIRNDIKIPYDILEYENFKKEIKDIAGEYKVNFISFENLVPPEFWGKKKSTSLKDEDEVDFMHFQAEGHRLLAKAMYLEISKIFQLTKKP
jgi:hypothetical protein